MAVITPLYPVCELASRASGALEVTLLWNRRSGELRVCVVDSHLRVAFELEAAPDNALDVFYHPYAHAAARGISYERANAALQNEEQPLRPAA